MVPMFKSIGLYCRTLRYLKLIQIVYRFRYYIEKKINRNIKPRNSQKPVKCQFPKLLPGIPSKTSWDQGTFTFIGISHHFSGRIDWECPDHGKLWTYNLNYFDFLNQADFDKKTGIGLIYQFIQNLSSNSTAVEPYPTSLRGINWIRFIAKNQISDAIIINSLYSQYKHLNSNIEYHLLGNHLLENAFSLFYAGHFFMDSRFLAKAKKILVKELDEQILPDGAHFELAPMYHQIILHRLLDCINLQQAVPEPDPELSELFYRKAQRMVGWLRKITWMDGSVPRVNDTAGGIAPTTAALLEYATLLKIKIPESTDLTLRESGYRKFINGKCELLMDVGNIGPDYIPGHAHSDTFSFELFIDQIPFIVDTGISTYENNNRRQLERSTRSHNTVMFDNAEQTEIWASHRVGRRAKVKILKDTETELSARHNGYRRLGASHTRTFQVHPGKLIISDRMDGPSQKSSVAFFHFFPGIAPLIADQEIITPLARLKFEGSAGIVLKNYEYARGFNDLKKGIVAEVSFRSGLQTNIAF